MKFLKLIAIIFFTHTLSGAIAQEAQVSTEKELIETALKLNKEGKNYAAIELCNKALAIYPNSAWAYNVRGFLNNANKQYDLAIQDYSQAIRLNPKYTNAINNRAIAYFTKQNYALAINGYSQVIEVEKTGVNYYNRGLAYLQKGEHDPALKDFAEAIKLDPNYAAASYANRSLIYKMKGMYDKGITEATEAIRVAPDYDYAFNARGYLYELKGQYDLAIKDYSEAIRLNPKFTTAYIYRGVSYKLKGLYSASIEEFKKALELEPQNGLTYINILSPLVRTFQFNQAKQYFEQYRAKVPGYNEELKSWGAYQKFITAAIENIPQNNYPKALVNLEIAIKEFAKELHPENKEMFIDILSLKGYVLEKLNRTAEATDVYNQTLVIHPAQPEVAEALNAIKKQRELVAKTDHTPPSIELIAPETTRGLSVVSAHNEVQIIGRAKDPSGIAEVKINGKTAKAEEDGLFVSSVSVKNGENSIAIVVTDKQGNTANKTFTFNGNVVVKSEAAPVVIPEAIAGVSSAKNFHAILIAEKDYQDPSIPDLENPVRDAKDLKLILQNNYTFRPENIDTLFNSNREDIMQAIVQKCVSLSKDDNLVIFYAGHGIAEKDKFGDVDGYWIPSSARKGNTSTYISSDDINKALKRSDSKHILVIADACFSGSFTRELPSDASLGIQKQFAVASRKIMASGNLEPVPDNSRFIYYLKKNLKENKEKYMTAKKLFDSFYEAILNNSETSPQYAAIKNVGDEGGEFVFIKK